MKKPSQASPLVALISFASFFFLLSTGPRAAFGQTQRGEGLKAEILAVRIPENRRPVVTFRITDAKGNPLDRSDIAELRFTIAALQADAQGRAAYRNYVLTRNPGKEYLYKGERRKPALAESLQPDYDHDGTFSRVKAGVFTYTFRTALPSGYDRKATHVVGGELTRDNRRQVANPLYEFVPAGGKPQPRPLSVQTASCNTCHDPLKAHGGLRREVGYCALCHTSQLFDPESGENLNFNVLIHKVHRGKHLPSVKAGKPYLVVGFRQQAFDFSTVGFPQDPRNCQACHSGPHAASWMNLPAAAPCTSCHDNVDLKSGKNHVAGAQADGTCAACHQPQGEEFGPAVAGAHTPVHKSSQLSGVVLDIATVEATKPGEHPVVTFSLKNKKGEPLEAARMANLRLVLSWPTTDYRFTIDEDARKAEPLGNGQFRYRFQDAIPPDAAGSGAVGIQGYRELSLKKADGNLIKGVRDAGFNIVKYFPITDAKAQPRRTVAKTESCNTCHERLALHGEARLNVDYCVQCHTAVQTDEVKRKTAKGPMPPANVHFKRLIHMVHTGEELGAPLVIYGGPPAKPGPIDLGEVRFPGDRRNCGKCHEKGTYDLPLPRGVLATAIPQSDGSVKAVPPITSACVSCHASEAALAHAETQIASGGAESCAVCHGAGREFDVIKAHRR